MKKILFTLMLLGCVACSESEDVNPREAYFLENIIGSWSYDTVKVNGETYLYQHTEGCIKDHFQFYNSEGKEFDFEERVVLNCSNCVECATSGTNLEWELKGDKIKLYFGEQLVLVYKIIEVNDIKFTYQVEIDYDDDGDKDLLEITGVRYDPYNEFN
jgi:hypothetical protein